MFSVDNNCVGCGLCAELCPAGIIAAEAGGAPFVAEETAARCIGCGQCVSFCPQSACRLGFQPAGDRVAVDARMMPSAESAETLLRSRRSVRRFKEEGLPRELISRLLESARYAPTAENSQGVRWIVSQTRERTRAIAEQTVAYFRRAAGGAEAASAGDDARLAAVLWVWDNGHDIITRGAPNLALAVMPADGFLADGAIALTYLELAAHANGVGCCWAGFVTVAARMSRELCEFVGVRDGETIVGGQMMGFPMPSVAMSRLLPPRKKIDVSWI